MLSGHKYSEAASAFRGYSAKFLSDEKINIFRNCFVSYELLWYLSVQAPKRGYKIKEVPVKMRLRETGESMHGGIIKPIKYMIRMFYEVVIITIKSIGVKRVK